MAKGIDLNSLGIEYVFHMKISDENMNVSEEEVES